MYKKTIFLISLFLLFGSLVNAEVIENKTYTVSADAFMWKNCDDNHSVNFGTWNELYHQSVYQGNESYMIMKFNDVQIVNATTMWLTCNVDIYGGVSIRPVTVANINDMGAFSSWSETGITALNMPCMSHHLNEGGTCNISNTLTGFTDCEYSGIDVLFTHLLFTYDGEDSNFESSGLNTIPMIYNRTWYNDSHNSGSWLDYDDTLDITFMLLTVGENDDYTTNLASKESGNGCNLTVMGFQGEFEEDIYATNLTLTVNVYDSVNSSQPIENANVTIDNIDPPIETHTSLTNSTGTVFFNITTKGEYDITITRFDYVDARTYAFLFYNNATVNVYLEQQTTDAFFNFTLYDRDTNEIIENVRVEFIECQGGDYAPFLDCAINYPNGAYTIIATRYTDSNGDWSGTITQMSDCFLIGYKKDDYIFPDSTALINVMAVCLEDSWYDSGANLYSMPYFNYSMSPDVTDVTVLFTVRDGDTYLRINATNLTVQFVTGIIETDLTDIFGEVIFDDDTGCWDITVSKSGYTTKYLDSCHYTAGNFTHDIYILSSTADTYNVTGFVFTNDDVLELADMYIDCAIFSYEYHEITTTNMTGQYAFIDIRENSACDIRVVENGYSEEVEHFNLLENTEINFTVTYLGKQINIDGIVTDCDSSIGLSARVALLHCGNITEYDPALACSPIVAQITGLDGEFEFASILEGWIQFIITEEYHEEISEVKLIQTDSYFEFCLIEGQPRYWLRGMVQNISFKSNGDIYYESIEAQVEVYNRDTNALVDQMTTKSINGYFDFFLRKENYVVIAKALGESVSKNIYLNHNYGQEELIFTLGSPTTNEANVEEFFSLLTEILPGIILLFIILMVLNAVKHTMKN